MKRWRLHIYIIRLKYRLYSNFEKNASFFFQIVSFESTESQKKLVRVANKICRVMYKNILF